MIISEETKVVILILISLPVLIIVLNQIRLLHLDEVKDTRQLSFKQRDWIINRNRRCKKK